MNLKYINKIKANISIFSSKKTNNILDGTYKSIYRGKSMNFENLREYVINDDIKDIDWKSSARHRSLLVKQFIAEKKHNIMLVMDTGLKMSADTDSNEIKKDVALYTAGTIGYLAIKNNDYVGMTYNKNDLIITKKLRYNLYNLEEYLTEYDKNACLNNNEGLEKTLTYLSRNSKKKMIIFVITDLKGLNSISTKILKELSLMHDVLFININDAYMFGDNLYDLDSNEYLPNILLNDEKLVNMEKETKEKIYNDNKERLRKNKICLISISNLKEINNKIIELLESHKYANFS